MIRITREVVETYDIPVKAFRRRLGLRRGILCLATKDPSRNNTEVEMPMYRWRDEQNAVVVRLVNRYTEYAERTN